MTFRLTSNDDGFRTSEFKAKSPGVTRIVTVGDSSTFGWGVDPEYTYQHLLEERFDRGRNSSAEVLNLGSSGHTSRHPAYELVQIRDVQAAATPDPGLYDPFEASRARAESEGDSRALVRSVSIESYKDNLRSIVARARGLGARAEALAVYSPAEYVAGMREVAQTEVIPLVDAGRLFSDNGDELRSHLLYAGEVRFYEELYGLDAIAERSSLYVTTDGCHPGRAGHRLIANALYAALGGGES